MRLLTICTILVAAVAIGASGCYSPPWPACRVACGANGACPGDLHCNTALGVCEGASACEGVLDAGTDGGGDPGGDWAAIAAGAAFNCALKTDRTLWCWGDDSRGQIGDGSASPPPGTPVQIDSNTDWFGLAAGDAHACALRGEGTTGTLHCWGAGDNYRLGDNTNTIAASPKQIGLGTDWIAVAAGGGHTCGLRGTPGDAELYCWGLNEDGQIGVGMVGTDIRIPTQIDTIHWQRVSTGRAHTCAIATTGALYCWGLNFETGALGTGNENDRSFPAEVAAGTSWQDIAAGGFHTCGIESGGAVRCWGRSYNGQVGDRTDIVSNHRVTMPTLVLGSPSVASLAVGDASSCGLSSDGALRCWGRNEWGELGDGTHQDRATPVVIASTVKFRALSFGDHHACGVTANGAILCWGDDDFGQLGRGTAGLHRTPFELSGTWAQVSAGYGHTCAISTAGELHCWGKNEDGQLGVGTRTAARTPIRVGMANNWSTISAGTAHTCGLITGGTVACFGDNRQGQLGTGTSGSGAGQLDPFTVGAGYAKVSAGNVDSCALTTTGALECWGRAGLLPEDLAPGITWTDASVNGPVCAIKSDQSLSCWQPENSITSGPITNDTSGWLQAVAGRYHFCGRRTDKTAWCLGVNYEGEVGVEPHSAYEPLTNALGRNDVEELAAGFAHTCARVTSGAVYCWGSNRLGQLGTGSSNPSALPSVAMLAANVQHISVGDAHSCAITSDARLFCWGSNAFGQLGDGKGGDPNPEAVH